MAEASRVAVAAVDEKVAAVDEKVAVVVEEAASVAAASVEGGEVVVANLADRVVEKEVASVVEKLVHLHTSALASDLRKWSRLECNEDSILYDKQGGIANTLRRVFQKHANVMVAQDLLHRTANAQSLPYRAVEPNF